MRYLKKLTLTKILMALLTLCFIGTCLVIFKGTEANVHSDTATAVLLAKEQLRTGQWFPSSWNYGQDIWVLSLNLIVLPFLAVLKDMVLSRELAVVVQTVIILVLMYQFVKRIASKEAGLLAAVAAVVPISAAVTEYYFYQATYNSQGLEMLVAFLLLYPLLAKECSKNKRILYNILLVLWMINLNSNGPRYLAVLIVPLLCALALYVLIETKFDFIKCFKDYKKYIFEILVICGGTVLGLGVYVFLCGHLNYMPGQVEMSFVSAEDASKRLLAVLASYFKLYGAAGINGILTIRGMIIFLKFVYMVISCVVAPIMLAKNYSKLTSGFQKIFLLFTGVVEVIILYLLVFGSLSGNERYIIVLYFCGIIMLALFYQQFIRKNINLAYLAVVCFFVPLTLGTYITWTAYLTINTQPGVSSREAFTGFLEEHDLHFGYTEYWLAYSNTMLSNGKYELNAVMQSYIKPQLWLNASEHYTSDYYDGRTFIMIPTESLYRVQKPLMDAVKEQYVFESYTVLVYDHNILYDESISTPFPKADGESVIYTLNTPGMYQEVNNDKFIQTEDGSFQSTGQSACIAAGPTVDLEPGTYTIEIELSVQDSILDIAGRASLAGNTGGKMIQEVDIMKDDTHIVMENIKVDEVYHFAEVRVTSLQGTLMNVKQIKVTKNEG
ncbi:MAG: hypothetical protein PHG07_00830 [Lachnospiraceae bacterium]|nr:hypothetical protein [Lachnospiraceae bacterium]